MGKRSQRRATRRQENDIGCMWGLIRMFYFRRDAKFLLDRRQGSRRHTFSGFAGRHSRKKSRDFEEIDEDRDTMEECSTRKPSIKRLMEDELGKVKQLKIPNDEVQRILADLGHDVCLDKSLMQNNESEGAKNHNTSITMASPSGSLDPSGSKCMKQAEEDDLELDVADFLGQIYRYHDDCKNKSKLCPELKSLIHTKLNELNVPHSDLAHEQTPENEEKELADNRNPGNSRQDQSTTPADALEMTSLDNKPFFKTLQKPNSHILQNIQKHQKRHVGTKSEPRKMLEKSVIVEDTKSSNKHELANKTQSKESRHIFFWKKDKSNRRHTSEGTDGSQPVSKIVILKPNPSRWIDPAVATTSKCLQQKSFTVQAPEYSATENSKFSIKEVRRRFRIVTGETEKGRFIAHEDGLQIDPHGPKDSIFTIRKDSTQVPEQTSAQKASATTNNSFRPSNSSTQMQRNDRLGEINSNLITSKDEFVFYEEAKKHLTEILKDKTQTAKYPTVQISRSLVGMLSLPQCSTSSPRSSPRVKDCIDLSPEEKNICAIDKAGREEFANERSKSEDDSGSVCGTNEAWDEQAVRERHFMEEEVTQHGDELEIACVEEIDKPDCSETICNTRCTPVEQYGYNSLLEMMEGVEPGKEHIEMFPSSPENFVEKSEHQEPKTPKPNASLELISQISPEGNHEKQEQPSPVSVLDSFFHEDGDSFDRETIIKCELRQDISRPQYSSDAGSDQEIFWEDKDVRLGYIKAVLELSELCTYQNLEVWYLYDELISPCLFEELHQGNQKNDLKLLFDCICEVITVIQGTYFRNPPCLSFLRHNIQSPPMGQNLVSEINKHIEGHLYHQFPSTLHQLIDMDLEDGTWMNLGLESTEIVVDIWEFILDELLEEVTYDVWI